jgi:hypothetical protein
MPFLREKPPRKDMPPCLGCDTCGDVDDRHLYLLGYTGKYYCKICFFKVAKEWPTPGGSYK